MPPHHSLHPYAAYSARPPPKKSQSGKQRRPLKASSVAKSTAPVFKEPSITYKNNASRMKIAPQKYIEAVKSVFCCLDIFQRKKISQANLTKNIPQGVLYFLGSVFQHIRQKHITVDQPEFIRMALGTYTTSSKEDTLAFIKAVELDNLWESKVESRIPVTNRLTNSPDKNKDNINTSFIKTSLIDPPLSNHPDESKGSSRKNNQLKELVIKETNIAEQQKIHSLQPKGPRRRYDRMEEKYKAIRKDIVENICQEPISVFTFYNHNKDKQNKQPKPIVYTELDCSLNTSLLYSQRQDRKFGRRGETDRIDELSNRLQAYIKLNVEKIEKSKHLTKQLK